MRSSILFVPLVLSSACVEGDVALFGCPDDEVCSPDAPNGLGFFGADLAGDLSLQPVATALGGTQSITLRKKVGTEFFDLHTPYAANGGSVLDIESTDGPVVTFRATGDAASGTLVIRDLDDQLLDRKTYPVHRLGRIGAVSENVEGTDLPFAFLAGDVRIGVGLYSEPDANGFETRLVDESMTIELADATALKFDLIELADVPAGTVTMTVTAADAEPALVEALIVDGVEQLVDHPGDEGFAVGATGTACFDAVTSGHYVAGLSWTITADNGSAVPFFSGNCVLVNPETQGSVTLTATAGGLTKEVTYPVAAASQKPRIRYVPRSQPEGVIAAASH